MAALKRKENDQTIIIKQPDKEDVIIIMDAEYYNLIRDQLKDITFYCEILPNIDYHTMKINKLLSKHHTSPIMKEITSPISNQNPVASTAYGKFITQKIFNMQQKNEKVCT